MVAITEEIVDLRLLAKLLKKSNNETRLLRKEVSEVTSFATQTYEFSRRVERRLSELRDDLELSIKMEFGGGITHLQTVLENTLSRIKDRLDGLGDRAEALERDTP